MTISNEADLQAEKCNWIRFSLFIASTIVIVIYIFILKSGEYSSVIYYRNRSVILPIKTHSVRHFRCIIYLKQRAGRLGNRMFMIASAYGLTRLHSCDLYIKPDIVHEMRKIFVFNLSSILITPSTFTALTENILHPMRKTSKNVECRFVIELTRPKAIPNNSVFEMNGYWQSYLHFAKYGDDIREFMFTANPSRLQQVSKFFIGIYSKQTNVKPSFSLENHGSFKRQLAQSKSITWIAVHIRRSDFVGLRFSSSDEYVFKAMNYYSLIYSNIQFIVASDDKSYCRKLFRNRANVFVTPRSFSQREDMIALSLCQHSIITGGTFGWWAAFLANGQVIHDTVYPSGCETREHYYPPWFLIDGKLRAHKNGNHTI